MRRRRLLRAVPVAALTGTVGIAGCLGDDDGDGDGGSGGDGTAPTATPRSTDSPTPTRTPEPTASPVLTDTRTATPTGTPTATPSPTPEADKVVTVGPEGRLVFEPKTFEVAVGETVRWEWASPGHNVSPESQPQEASWPGDDETTYPAGRTYAYTFTVAGRYVYHCDPHQSVGMRGSFTVR